jgi:hypothetical protein
MFRKPYIIVFMPMFITHASIRQAILLFLFGFFRLRLRGPLHSTPGGAGRVAFFRVRHHHGHPTTALRSQAWRLLAPSLSVPSAHADTWPNKCAWTRMDSRGTSVKFSTDVNDQSGWRGRRRRIVGTRPLLCAGSHRARLRHGRPPAESKSQALGGLECSTANAPTVLSALRPILIGGRV